MTRPDRRGTRRRLLGLVVVLVIAGAGTPAQAGDQTVAMGRNNGTPVYANTTGFTPSTPLIPAGGQLQFTNLDRTAHDITSVARTPQGFPVFGGTAAWVYETIAVARTEVLAPGRYAFLCSLHPEMTGELIVVQ